MSDAQYPATGAKIWGDHINPRLFELVHSPNLHERMGGVLAIDRLLEIEHDDAVETRATKYYRFYQYVKSALLFGTDADLTGAATKTLNRVLELGGNFGDAFMQSEVPRLLELLRNEKDFNRYGAVLILKALRDTSATNSLHSWTSSWNGSGHRSGIRGLTSAKRVRISLQAVST